MGPSVEVLTIQMVPHHWTRWPACPYMVKTLKNLKNQESFVAESWNISPRTLSSIKFIQMMIHVIFSLLQGWSDVAKVSCILRHRGGQLILAFSWLRPAILVAGKGRGGMFLFLLFISLIPVPLSSLFLTFVSSTISSLFSPFLWDPAQNDPQGSLNTNTINLPSTDSRRALVSFWRKNVHNTC